MLFVLAAFAGRGMDWVEPPRTDAAGITGRIRLRDGRDPALRLGLDFDVDGTRVAGHAAFPAARDGVTTVLAFDQSGSFRRFHDQAFDLARVYTENRLDNEAVGLMVFGQTARSWPPAATDTEIAAQLGEARALGSVQKETRLTASIRSGVEQLSSVRPLADGGVRSLLVFTDAGEESEVFSVEEIADYALDRLVTVNAVVFVRPGASKVAEDLDRVARLVALTGGTVLEVSEGTAVDIAALPERSRELWTVGARWCGSERPKVAVVGPKGQHTDALPLEGALTPCEVAEAPPPSPVSVPPSRESIAPADAKPHMPGKLSGLLCLVLALVGFLVLGALAAWVAKREVAPAAAAPPPQPPTPEPRRPPPPPVAPVPPPVPRAESKPLAVNRPETHLSVVRGDLPAGTRWRFAGRILRLGASEEDNEAVVNLPQISSRHARFELFPTGAVFVEDLGSANGTWVGRERLTPGQRTEIPAGVDVTVSSQLVVRISRPNTEST